MSILGNGNVGIGTASPGVKLHVVGDIQLDDSAPFLLFKETGANKDMQFKLQTDGRLSLLNDNGTTEVLTVSQSGNIGIGTSTPAVPLEIYSTTDEHLRINNPDGGWNFINFNHAGTTEAFVGTNGDEEVILGSTPNNPIAFYVQNAIRAKITNATIQPGSDDAITLGTAALRFSDVFATQTTTGGIFETGLKTEKIGDNPTGTIVSWKEDGLVPCDKNEDELVMGVIKKGKDEPIVLGAEPVLVTGKVNVGDYIVTSDKIGHGKSVKRGYLLKKNLFGKVIAQALESCDGDSNLIKCMIRKM